MGLSHQKADNRKSESRAVRIPLIKLFNKPDHLQKKAITQWPSFLEYLKAK